MIIDTGSVRYPGNSIGYGQFKCGMGQFVRQSTGSYRHVTQVLHRQVDHNFLTRFMDGLSQPRCMGAVGQN